MLKVNKENLEDITLELKLTDSERAVLFSFVKQQGFDLIQQLMEEAIRHLHAYHMNVAPQEETKILATFRMVKGAEMFYAEFIQRLQDELQQYSYKAANLGTPQNPEESATVVE